MTAPDPQQPQGGDPQATSDTPPWGSDENFNAGKAWKLVENLRSEVKTLKARPAMTDADRTKIVEADKLLEAQKSDLDKATESVTRWQTEAQTWRDAAVGSTVRALAAADFADPDDAIRNLDPAKYLDAGGAIDETAIQRDLTGLLDAKPHYRRSAAAGQSAAPRTPAPNTAQGKSGAGGGATDPAQAFAGVLGAALAR